MVVAALALGASDLRAATVTAVWNPNPEADIGGYVLSYGTQSGTYTTVRDVGNVTTCELVLPAGRYYFVLQAYSIGGSISERSPEVVADIVEPPANQAPALTPPANQLSAEGTTVSLQLSATDPEGDPIAYSATGLPAGLSVDAGSGVISGTLPDTSAGSYIVAATASDGSLSSSQTFTWTVTDVGPPPITPLPAPWQTSDVGNPTFAGSVIHAAGTLTLAGAGVERNGVSDQFRFVYYPLVGNVEVVARVSNLQAVDPGALAGVTIREDLAPDSPHATAGVTAGQGFRFQSRGRRGLASTSGSPIAGAAPQWIRIVRNGALFTGSASADGTTWTSMGAAIIPMGDRVYVGVSVASQHAAVPATAVFSEVTVTRSGSSSSPPTVVSAEMPVDTVRTPPATASALARADAATVLDRRVSEWSEIPVAADYDGDGKMDMASYRPSAGTWSILTSRSRFMAGREVILGAVGDVPVPADYDGDGITDPAVYSPSTGLWTARLSTNSARVVVIARHGTPADVPATGDYDGDGQADLAVLHEGTWQVLYSSTGYTTGVAIPARRAATVTRTPRR